MADPDQSAASPAQGGEQRGNVDVTGGSTRGEGDLLDSLIVIAKRKKQVLGFTLGATLVAAFVSFVLPKWYEGTARILPPQQQQSTAAAMLGQLGSLVGSVGGSGIGASLGLKSPSDLYVGMLRSRTVSDAIIKRFDLLSLYDRTYVQDARRDLERNTAIKAGRDGIISIDVEDRDPKRAADMANAYVEELNKLTQTIAVTEAAQRRQFFERQLTQAKDNLIAAEVAARQGLTKGGITQVDAQGRSMIEVTARLRAQVSGKEVQLSAMRSFAAENNPDLQRTQQELDALKRELARVEGSIPFGDAGAGDVTGRAGLNNVGLLRNVKYYEYLYEFMARQFEVAKVDEAKESTLMQVVDYAIVPERRVRPRRALIVLVTAVVASFLAIAWALIRENLDRAQTDPAQAERLRTLRRYIAWR